MDNIVKQDMFLFNKMFTQNDFSLLTNVSMANSRRVIVQDEQTSYFCSINEKKYFPESKNKCFFKKIIIREGVKK